MSRDCGADVDAEGLKEAEQNSQDASHFILQCPACTAWLCGEAAAKSLLHLDR